ncbi:MAG: hypothetical protein SFY56_06910 [Bacteroidota bacterium]|nr:hypothetical protein [Bacteroidota bacterium]
MLKKISLVVLFIFLIQFNCFSQININIWRAGKNVDKNNIKQAKKLYTKVLKKHPESYRANLGMGLLLSETIEDYSSAIPYLEKVIAKQKKDTVADLIYALSKCYQFNGQFNKAILFLNKLDNVKAFEDDNKEFKSDIAKRKIDCNYSLKNYDSTKTIKFNKMFIENLGNIINTEAPEYVPVFNKNNELIYTSKRKINKKVSLNIGEAKYGESMFIAKYDHGKIEEVKPYSPLSNANLKSIYGKNNESVISTTGDGKKLFVYRDGQIYETNIDELEKKNTKQLSKAINNYSYKSHAFLSNDGNTLYFTSDSKKGLGGYDIYKTTKIKEGQWTAPENLGATINTPYDEDAPYLSDDGLTLYFSSKGHEGFGGYDVYKTNFENGKWTSPKNLGQPINSTGNDIFYILHLGSGYFSSSRSGGFGAMDIYKITYGL